MTKKTIHVIIALLFGIVFIHPWILGLIWGIIVAAAIATRNEKNKISMPAYMARVLPLIFLALTLYMGQATRSNIFYGLLLFVLYKNSYKELLHL